MNQYSQMLAEAEDKYGLPRGLLHAQMEVESGGDPSAVSKRGAQGLMQFMPATAQELGIDPTDPVQAIDGAGRYMSKLIKTTGNVRDAVAAYNWGIGNVRRNGLQKAPVETQDYIRKVSTGMKKYANMPSTAAGNGMIQIDPNQVQWDEAPEIDPGQVQWDQPKQPKERTFMSNLGRQVGLTARDILEGTTETLGIIGDPANTAVNMTLGTNLSKVSDMGDRAADFIGLPEPETAVERVANQGAKFALPTAGFIKGGKLAGDMAKGPVSDGLAMLANRPGLQLASAGGAGTAGQAAKEDGSGFGGQLSATILGGIAAPTTVAGLTGAIKNGVAGIAAGAKEMLGQINPQKIEQTIVQTGIDLSKLPGDIANALRRDVGEALKVSPEITPESLRRLLDYRLTGLTPMRSNITLDPVQITQDRNLAKISANSKDPQAQVLSRLQRENNDKLLQNMNELGANSASEPFAAGQRVIGALDDRNSQMRSVINRLYDNARQTAGRDAQLDPSYFSNRFNDLIDYNNLGDVLSTKYGGLVGKLNSIAAGKVPLTVDVAEQLKTSIGKLSRNETDGNVRTALSLIRQSLDETPLLPNQGLGEDAIKAFTTARKVNAKWMSIVERTPALQAIRDGVEPDQFVKKYITGQTVTAKDLDNLRKAVSAAPEVNLEIRNQIAAYLKKAAANGAADEVATFSQKGYNKALSDIGKQKLSIFFTPQEVEQLRRIGRVASYETFQGAGSAVNNSNTASAAFTAVLDKIINSSVVRAKIPYANVLASPIQDMQVAGGARNALNAGKVLAAPKKAAPRSFAPVGALPGLLENNGD